METCFTTLQQWVAPTWLGASAQCVCLSPSIPERSKCLEGAWWCTGGVPEQHTFFVPVCTRALLLLTVYRGVMWHLAFLYPSPSPLVPPPFPCSYLPELEAPTGVSAGEFAKFKPFLAALCWEVLVADMRQCAEKGRLLGPPPPTLKSRLCLHPPLPISDLCPCVTGVVVTLNGSDRPTTLFFRLGVCPCDLPAGCLMGGYVSYNSMGLTCTMKTKEQSLALDKTAVRCCLLGA